MNAMLLAAGFGRRLLDETSERPKALVSLHGDVLIRHQLRALHAAGAQRVVINLGYRGEMIVEELKRNPVSGPEICYSQEPADNPLETGGGIRNALGQLGSEPFWVLNCDAWGNFQWQHNTLPEQSLGQIWVVEAQGTSIDFSVSLGDARIHPAGAADIPVTYTGAGMIHPDLVHLVDAERYSLAQCLHIAVSQQRLHGLKHSGAWLDVGTPQDLERARATAI